jgi:hypothetical protein
MARVEFTKILKLKAKIFEIIGDLQRGFVENASRY